VEKRRAAYYPRLRKKKGGGGGWLRKFRGGRGWKSSLKWLGGGIKGAQLRSCEQCEWWGQGKFLVGSPEQREYRGGGGKGNGKPWAIFHLE